MTSTTSIEHSTSTQSRYFQTHTVETAPAEAAPFLRGVQQKFGFLPLATARHATAPGVVEAFGLLLQTFAKTSLSELEREALALLLAGKFDCKLCRDLHRHMAKAAGASSDEITALIARDGISDPRLRALAAFAERVVETRGAVADPEIETFLAAGFTTRQALEVVLGIATYTLSIFANRLTRAETIR
jgi:AhpD family alkylhydroperoxidase